MNQHRQRIGQPLVASMVGTGLEQCRTPPQQAVVRELRQSVQELERELERKNAALEKTMALLMNSRRRGRVRSTITD